MEEYPGNCQRCGGKASSIKMSYFNTQMLCPQCSRDERKHPDFEKARDAETAAVRAGNYNFPGIGLPDDTVEETA